MKTWLLSVFAAGCAAVSLAGQAPEITSVPDPVDKIRREAWAYAVLVVAQIEAADPARFPAIDAWLADLQKVGEVVGACDPARPLPAIDSDALVTRNARFWAAYYEFQPADPALSLLHAALLLAGGEAQRAAYVATIGLQRPATAPELRHALLTIIAYSQAAQERSLALVREGVKRHDGRDFEGALRQIDLALADWPANGQAHFERGLVLRMQALLTAGGPQRKSGDTLLPESEHDPAAVTAAFARARRHDPFQIMAYQGDDSDLLTAFMALVRTGLPTWEIMRKHPAQPVPRPMLVDFGDACRQAGIDDLALAVRQHLVVRNKRYQPDDQAFIGDCLRRLAPGDSTKATLARLDTDHPLLPKLAIVLPVPEETADSAVDPEASAEAGEKPAKKSTAKKPGASKKTTASSSKGKNKKKKRS